MRCQYIGRGYFCDKKPCFNGNISMRIGGGPPYLETVLCEEHAKELDLRRPKNFSSISEKIKLDDLNESCIPE